MKEVWVWKCLNRATNKIEFLEFGRGKIPPTREFEIDGVTYRREALEGVRHGKSARGSMAPGVVVQRDVEDVVCWQADQWDPAFDKYDTNPNSPSYGQPVFGSRDDVRRGLRNLKDRGCEAEYGEGLSRIRP